VLLTTVIVECISREELHIVEPKATCHITRQASINARASVWYPIYTVKQAALLTRDESLRIIFENRRLNVISLNQPLEYVGFEIKLFTFRIAYKLNDRML